MKKFVPPSELGQILKSFELGNGIPTSLTNGSVLPESVGENDNLPVMTPDQGATFVFER
jgi:hypothetical protein